MESKEYVTKAARTSKKFNNGLTLNRGEIALIREALRTAERLGIFIDKIKRSLMYGTSLDVPGMCESLALKVDTPTAPDLYLTTMNAELFHAGLGKLTESIEFFEWLMPMFEELGQLDFVRLLEEMGDGFWYDAVAVRAMGCGSFDTCFQANIAKLLARYPGKFSKEKAVDRDLVTEKKALYDEVLKEQDCG